MSNIYDPISIALNMRPMAFTFVLPVEDPSEKTPGPNKGGYFLSEETRVKMRKLKSLEHALNISKAQRGVSVPGRGNTKGSKRPGIGGVPKGTIPWNVGKKHSEQTLVKIKERALKREKKTCPHCNKSCSPVNAKRWHFDNCKIKKSSS